MAGCKRTDLLEQYRLTTRRKVLFSFVLATMIAILAGAVAILGEANIGIAGVSSCILARFFPG